MKKLQKLCTIFVFIFSLFFVLSTINAEPALIEPKDVSPQETKFKEVWAYLMAGEESYLSNDLPITDIGYFGAEINSYGELISVPDVSRLDNFSGRVHLVIACNSTALTHFAISRDGNVRRQLIKDILKATENYDGLQIDFELVPKRDTEVFLDFLKDLKKGLKHKILTVALPARTKTLENDVYDYKNIAEIADKIFVMAYDEHWSGGSPGPVASLDWCYRIADYAIETVGKDKFIMGIPFYGRTWGNVSLNRAFYFSGIQRIMRENNVKEVRRETGIPTFTYTVPSVTVTGYYDDVHSLSLRLKHYENLELPAVGFWCLGQEDPRIWDYIEILR